MKKLQILFTVFIISSIFFGLVNAYPSVYPFGVTVFDEEKAYEGYTSIATLGIGRGNTTVRIMDMMGNSLHEWFIGDGGTIHNLVLEDGRLFSNVLGPKCPVMGCASKVEMRDWYGNLLWKYENPSLHHRADLMPDNSIVAIFWEELPEEYHGQIQGGIPGTEREDGKWYTDALRIINRNKDVVWEWYPYEELNISEWTLGHSDKRDYWPNINNVDYLPEGNPYNGREGLLVSFRKIDTIAIIDIETKEVVWKWGKGQLAHQHDPHMLENGNIIIFDNGFLRPDLPELRADMYFSRILEINPSAEVIVWEYKGPKERGKVLSFYSHIGGYVERLTNGNTLITESETGRVFEVDSQGKIVWEYVNELTRVDSVFRFTPEDVNWPEELPSPVPSDGISNEFSLSGNVFVVESLNNMMLVLLTFFVLVGVVFLLLVK